MVTVFRDGALRFAIYSNDHEPVHVHVLTPDGSATLDLSGPDVRLDRVHGLSNRQARDALAMGRLRRDEFRSRWEDIHGPIRSR